VVKVIFFPGGFIEDKSLPEDQFAVSGRKSGAGLPGVVLYTNEGDCCLYGCATIIFSV
jgi:hypothetical protein